MGICINTSLSVMFGHQHYMLHVTMWHVYFSLQIKGVSNVGPYNFYFLDIYSAFYKSMCKI